MFHVQLRQFPHNFCAFNLSEAELLQTLVEPWSRDQWVELGERKWSPHQARLTVLEGPHLPVEELSLGRGWSTAQHQCEDVTERMLARAKGTETLSPVMEISSLLGTDPDALLQAWRLATERRPELSPSESLALAEDALRSLDGSRP